MHLSVLLSGGGRGVVTRFDESAGLGVITGSDGTEVPFHCTTISDGTRVIELGTAVYFSIFPALGGRAEALRVEKL